MKPSRARVIRASPTAAAPAEPLFAPGASPAQRRRIARELIEARLEADTVRNEARLAADDIVRRAREQAAREAAQAAREAREQEEARFAAGWIALRHAEDRRLERDAGRVIAVAVALAERLVGAALALDPARIADLAKTALAEARGARRVAIEASPQDAEALRHELAALGVDGLSADVCADETLARGELRLHTDMGTIDAKLAPRLDRLAAALRDAIR
jgi:flagellar biosynthesis/type III secretory pathway protein FliH